MQENAYQLHQGIYFPCRHYCERGGRRNADRLLSAKADDAIRCRGTQLYHQIPTGNMQL